MRVKTTIRKMIFNYPTGERDHIHCLLNLFCVLGNGFDWDEGQLVHWRKRGGWFGRKMPSPEERAQEFLEERIEWFDIRKLIVDEEHRQKLLDDYEKDRVKALEILKTVEERIKPGYKCEPVKWVYPLCEQSNLNKIPDDVQPDWLAAAREVIGVILNTNEYDNRVPNGDPVEEVRNNQEWARKIKEDLDRRFPQ